MTPWPRVSVIVATNRASGFLAEGLQSVADQDYPEIETLVIDDGSPDPRALRAAIEPFDVTYVRIPPSGVSAARNLGARRSTSDYLLFLDDDDRWHPERVSRQVAAMAARPGAVAGYCGIRSIDVAGNEIAPADQVAVSDKYAIARRRTGILMPNLMVRRGDYAAIGGLNPALRLAEDLDLVLRLAERGPFAFAPGALVDYRRHASNVTGKYRDLAVAIRGVLSDHRERALAAGDRRMAAALTESLRSNRRFAWWSALRETRGTSGGPAFVPIVGEVAWAMRFAPTAPVEAMARRWPRRRAG